MIASLRMAPEASADVVSGLRRWFPVHTSIMGEDALHRFAALAEARARRHGAGDAADAARLGATMVLLGSEFENDPLLPWAGEILAGGGASPSVAIRALLAATLDWADQTAGVTGDRLDAALRRIQAYPFMSPVEKDHDDGELLRVMEHIHPERATITPEVAFGSLPRRARAMASRYCGTDRRAPVMFCLSMFLLGHGFDEDPQLPWARAALTRPLERGVERVWALHADAMVHVGRLLAMGRRER